jgi:hypothetical protein
LVPAWNATTYLAPVQKNKRLCTIYKNRYNEI